MKKQAGFTLIELAIVLVIIGLLLGGVLKGQELINSAKVKSIANDFKNVQVFIYGYQDKYKAIPGDDNRATDHVGLPNAVAGTHGNGLVEGAWDETDPDLESVVFWQHVRKAGLAPGKDVLPTSADDEYFPVNADGGRIGVQSLSNPDGTYALDRITNMAGSYVVCSKGVLGKFAKQLDITLDNGTTNTGSVRAVLESGSDDTDGDDDITGSEENANYIVCMSF